MILQGERVTIRDYLRSDVDTRCKWQPFADPFLEHLNLRLGLPKHRDRWFEERLERRDALWYAIEDENRRMIGEIMLRDISWNKKTAVLSILLGAEYANRGYGTKAIEIMLSHLFNALEFNALSLDVAAHNRGAIRCYEKCGFKKIGTHWDRPNPRFDIDIFSDDKYIDLRKFFRRNPSGKTEVLFIDMQIIRKNFEKNRR